MTYKRFEEVPVWRDAADLAAVLFEVAGDEAFRRKGDLANQMQRAALSVSNNIAEGFERGTTQELITFVYYARGSAGEVRSILCVMERMTAFGHLKSQISDLKSKVESISRQLRTWAESLQNTDIRGQRYLTDRSRGAYEQDRKAASFFDQLRKQHEERLQRMQRECSTPV